MNWAKVAIGEVCNVVSGATPKTNEPSYWGGDICWATPKDLSELTGPIINSTFRRITELGLRSCAASILPPGSVLLSSRAPIGLVAINAVPMATNQGFKSLIPKEGVIHAGYLYHWLYSQRRYLDALGNGATFREVSKAVVSRVMIPLPSLNEQIRIATLLDNTILQRQRHLSAIEQLDTLYSSLQHRAFSGQL